MTENINPNIEFVRK